SQPPWGTCGRAVYHSLVLAYLQDQTFEVAQAIAYLSAMKNAFGVQIINPGRIAIMGHSYGGMVTVFNNRFLNTHSVAVDIAGASESWESFDGDDGASTPDSSASITML